MENENEYGTVELGGKKYIYLVNDEYVEYLGDKDGNVYKGSYESGKLESVTLVASPKSNVEKAILSHLLRFLGRDDHVGERNGYHVYFGFNVIIKNNQG
jgi:hypothetical protein